MKNNEFSRPVRLDTIGTQARAIRIEADETERKALARRFSLSSLGRLEAELNVHSAGEDVVATGRMQAELVQACVATGAPVPTRIDEAFSLRFRPEGIPEEGFEVELEADELDTLFYEGSAVDVGEAVAQTLALALDPYPRADDAAQALRDAGVKDESEAGPFGALAGLKDKLGK